MRFYWKRGIIDLCWANGNTWCSSSNLSVSISIRFLPNTEYLQCVVASTQEATFFFLPPFFFERRGIEKLTTCWHSPTETQHICVSSLLREMEWDIMAYVYQLLRDGEDMYILTVICFLVRGNAYSTSIFKNTLLLLNHPHILCLL